MKKTYITPSLKALRFNQPVILAGSGDPDTTIQIPVGGYGNGRAKEDSWHLDEWELDE